MRLSQEMPELEGFTHEFNPREEEIIRDLLGQKPTLVHFWSADLDLSVNNLEDFKALVESFENRVRFVSIHVPQDDGKETLELKEFVKENELKHTILIDGNNDLTEKFQNQFLPAYYFFGTEGTLVHYQAGGGGMKMLKKQLEKVAKSDRSHVVL